MSSKTRVVSLLVAMLLSCLTAAHAQEGLPSYQLQFLGPGSPVAINNTGTVVGALVSGSTYQPLVSEDGARWRSLPVPAGSESTFPTDVNDFGVIVGVSYTAWNAVAVRWTPSAAGYAVEVLPRLPGDGSSYATAINNLGQIVGARRALGYVPAATSGWLYSDKLGVVDLQGKYGWWVYPTDVNDDGVLIAGTERLTLTTGVIEAIGQGPSNYGLVTGVAINNDGMVGGSAVLRSSSLNIVSVFRYVEGTGWSFIAGSSRYTTLSSINNRGDIGYGELGAGLYLDGLGAFALWSLLDPAVSQAGWAITGAGTKINDQRVVATLARNSVTGESGGVLLTPAGTVQPPPAPVLTGVAHPWAPDAPWDAVSLTWTASQGASRYVVERKGPADAGFLTVTPASGTIQLKYDDTAILPQTLYTYRVFAVGVAGLSASSNEVTVLSPGGDTVAPQVTIVYPAPNARVSGLVPVLARASDDKGVVRMDLRTAAGAVLTTVAGAELRYTWNTTRLRKGSTQSLVVRAYDAAGNVGTATVVVRIAR